MKKSFLLMMIVGVLGIGEQWVYCQSSNGIKADGDPGCVIPTPETLKNRGQLTDDQEIRYRSPIRYVIVYNDIGPTGDRRIDLLMNVGNINEKDLRTVFCWIGERFGSPIALTINVHTNLATIETPDERELLHDSDDSRFSKYYSIYRRADYHRYESGREAFAYTIRLSPYREREVLIRKSN